MFIDMTGFENTSFNYIDTVGTFEVLCEGVVNDSSKVSDYDGKPYAEIRFRTRDDASHKERFYLNDKSLWKIGALMSAIGIDTDTIKKVNSIETINKLIKNKPLIIKTKIERGAEDPVTRESKEYIRIDRFIKLA